MKLSYLFDTNAVLLDEKNPNKELGSYTFRFLGHRVTWKANDHGKNAVLEVVLKNINFAKKLELVLKFASVIVYRNTHIERFRYVFSTNANIGGSLKSTAGIETRFSIIGNENHFSKKMWSMLSFYLEAKNSSSTFYKFICLYKIIEIENLIKKRKNGKQILVEDKYSCATKKFLDNEIPKLLTKDELKGLGNEIKTSSLKQKTIGEYYKHLFRDAFSHTGFLEANNYQYGYPTLNPSSLEDINRYDKAIYWFDQLAKKILKANEPK